MRLPENMARIGEIRNALRVLVGEPERKGLLGRNERRWWDNNEVYLK
jgi:hypothetical protein